MSVALIAIFFGVFPFLLLQFPLFKATESLDERVSTALFLVIGIAQFVVFVVMIGFFEARRAGFDVPLDVLTTTSEWWYLGRSVYKGL